MSRMLPNRAVVTFAVIATMGLVWHFARNSDQADPGAVKSTRIAERVTPMSDATPMSKPAPKANEGGRPPSSDAGLTSALGDRAVGIGSSKSAWLSRWQESGFSRAFVVEALGQPTSGGWLYASKALDDCRTMQVAQKRDGASLQLPVSHPMHAEVNTAYQRLQAVCSQFTAEDLQGSPALYSADRQGQDPLLSAIRDYRQVFERQTTPLEQRSRALSTVLSTQDPLVLSWLGPQIAMVPGDSAGSDGVYVYLASERVRLGNNPSLARAFDLLPCEFGLPCDLRDAATLSYCAAGGECFANRYELVRRFHLNGDDAAYERTLRYVRDLAAAVRSKYVSYFSPQRVSR
jgi:hypothetical protein